MACPPNFLDARRRACAKQARVRLSSDPLKDPLLRSIFASSCSYRQQPKGGIVFEMAYTPGFQTATTRSTVWGAPVAGDNSPRVVGGAVIHHNGLDKRIRFVSGRCLSPRAKPSIVIMIDDGANGGWVVQVFLHGKYPIYSRICRRCPGSNVVTSARNHVTKNQGYIKKGAKNDGAKPTSQGRLRA